MLNLITCLVSLFMCNLVPSEPCFNINCPITCSYHFVVALPPYRGSSHFRVYVFVCASPRVVCHLRCTRHSSPLPRWRSGHGLPDLDSGIGRRRHPRRSARRSRRHSGDASARPTPLPGEATDAGGEARRGRRQWRNIIDAEDGSRSTTWSSVDARPQSVAAEAKGRDCAAVLPGGASGKFRLRSSHVAGGCGCEAENV